LGETCATDTRKAILGKTRRKVLLMRFFPKRENFFDYFEQLADKIEEGGQFFLEMTQNDNYTAARVSRLKEIEHEADGIAHRTYEKMNKSFLTPIDREDIYALINKMDDILDNIEGTAIRIYMYKVQMPNDAIIRQAEILFQAIQKVKGIVYGIRNVKESQLILNGCVEIHALENAGDIVLRTVMTDLFIKEDNPVELIKWKEIFERLETAMDVCETVSHIVEGIVMKHA
jgi:uncharacterized protein